MQSLSKTHVHLNIYDWREAVEGDDVYTLVLSPRSHYPL
jgi:hypothetical protein